MALSKFIKAMQNSILLGDFTHDVSMYILDVDLLLPSIHCRRDIGVIPVMEILIYPEVL